MWDRAALASPAYGCTLGWSGGGLITTNGNPRSDLVSIGRFAALTGISAKTLRRYDKSGLLAPAFVDPFTGYRLYSLAQLDVAVTIHLLRELDMPLAEIRDLVRSGDAGRMREILRDHRRQVAAHLAETQRILARLDARCTKRVASCLTRSSWSISSRSGRSAPGRARHAARSTPPTRAA